MHSLTLNRCGLALLFLFATGPLLEARQYKQEKFDKQGRLLRSSVQRTVKDASAYAGQKEKVKEFFTTYYFPVMTQATPEGLSELGTLNSDLFRRYIWPAANQAVQQDLTQLAYKYCSKLSISTDYHPAVRLNALMILGKLDQKYATDGPPTPLPQANELMLKFVQGAGKSAKVTPALVSGALVGLERHARFHEAIPNQVPKMEAAFLGLIKTEKPINEIDPDVHFWLQRQAASGLANLGSNGQNNTNLAAVVSLMANESMSLDGRCDMAYLLTKFDLTPENLEATKVIPAIALLAEDVADKALEDAQEFEDLRISGRGRRRGEELKLERRQLIMQLDNLYDSLEAIQAVASENMKLQATELMDAISPVRTSAKNSDTLDLQLVQRIKEMAVETRTIAMSLTDPAAGEVDEEEEAEVFVN